MPLLWNFLAVFLGSWMIGGRFGTQTGRRFAVLWAFAPPAFLQLSMIAWGNHLEAGLLGWLGLLCLAADRPRSRAGGLLLGVGLYAGLSVGPSLIAALSLGLWRKSWSEIPRFLSGFIPGIMPLFVSWAITGMAPFGTIYEEGESLPDPRRIPHKLATLLGPRQLWGLFGLDPGWNTELGAVGSLFAFFFLIALGWASVSLWRAQRGGWTTRAISLGIGAWILIYLLVRFQLDAPEAPTVPRAGGLRYAAPLYPLLLTLLAIGLDRPRWTERLLMSGAIAAGLLARGLALNAPFPALTLADQWAPDWRFAREQLAWAAPATPEQLRDQTDAAARAVGTYGWARETTRLLRHDPHSPGFSSWQLPADLPRGPLLEGIGEGLAADLQGEAPDLGIRLAQVQVILTEQRPDLRPEERAWVERAAVRWWIQQGVPDPRIAQAESLNGESFLRLQHSLSTVAAADALYFGLGERWAARTVGPHVPRPFVIPPEMQSAPPAFFEGVAAGLAAHWGPSARHQLQGLQEPDSIAAADRGWSIGQYWIWRNAPFGPDFPR